jgi:hypothetical protein
MTVDLYAGHTFKMLCTNWLNQYMCATPTDAHHTQTHTLPNVLSVYVKRWVLHDDDVLLRVSHTMHCSSPIAPWAQVISGCCRMLCIVLLSVPVRTGLDTPGKEH